MLRGKLNPIEVIVDDSEKVYSVKTSSGVEKRSLDEYELRLFGENAPCPHGYVLYRKQNGEIEAISEGEILKNKRIEDFYDRHGHKFVRISTLVKRALKRDIGDDYSKVFIENLVHRHYFKKRKPKNYNGYTDSQRRDHQLIYGLLYNLEMTKAQHGVLEDVKEIIKDTTLPREFYEGIINKKSKYMNALSKISKPETFTDLATKLQETLK